MKAKGNKTIICNGTGKMWACGGKTPCFCDAANKERFYPGENDLAQVVDSAQDQDGLGHPFWGIIHVPHVNEKRASFNKSLAGFLATAGGAGTPFGYGVGFEYDCEQGGWLREYAELDQSVGPPAGPPKITNMSGGGGRGPTTAIFTRRYASGVRAFFNASTPPPPLVPHAWRGVMGAGLKAMEAAPKCMRGAARGESEAMEYIIYSYGGESAIANSFLGRV